MKILTFTNHQSFVFVTVFVVKSECNRFMTELFSPDCSKGIFESYIKIYPLQRKTFTQTHTLLRILLLVFIEDFSHGEGDLGNFLVLGVGAHVGTCQSYPVLLCTVLVIR